MTANAQMKRRMPPASSDIAAFVEAGIAPEDVVMETIKSPDGTVRRVVRVKGKDAPVSDLQGFLNQNPQYDAA